jgi:putative ABC transport system permease protein
MKLQHIKQFLNSQQEIVEVSFCGTTYPFSFSQVTTSENDVGLGFVGCDENFFDVLNIQFLKGKSFTLNDRRAKLTPVVLNQQAADALFQERNPVGNVFGNDSNLVVTGIVDKYRYTSSFSEDSPVMFRLYDLSDSNLRYQDNILVRVQPGTSRAYEAQLVDELNQIVPGWDVEVQWLTDQKKTKDKMSIGFIWILIVVAIFLIINVILGLFGLLWYNINLRKSEIGLRRALGASKKEITRHFIKETAVLATSAAILGLLFAVQFPVMGVFDINPGVYLLSILCSLVFLYCLILLCALAPSRQASEVEPAIALYEE